jgi:hypothetical protein
MGWSQERGPIHDLLLLCASDKTELSRSLRFRMQHLYASLGFWSPRMSSDAGQTTDSTSNPHYFNTRLFLVQ